MRWINFFRECDISSAADTRNSTGLCVQVNWLRNRQVALDELFNENDVACTEEVGDEDGQEKDGQDSESASEEREELDGAAPPALHV